MRTLQVIEITDDNASELDIYNKLGESQLLHYYEPDEGIFIAESPIVIERAIQAGYEPISVLADETQLQSQVPQLAELYGDLPIYTASEDILSKITGFKLTRGILCAMRRRRLPSVAEICQGTRRVVVLENVVNPTNVGAIFRSAAALNMDAVLLTKGCSDPLYRRSVRVSMGTVFQIPWTYLDRDDYVQQLHELGFRCAAMALESDSVNVNDPKLMQEKRLAVIMGTEGDGLARNTIESCDYTVCIPMAHGVDSLNVAAASAVAFWQLGQ